MCSSFQGLQANSYPERLDLRLDPALFNKDLRFHKINLLDQVLSQYAAHPLKDANSFQSISLSLPRSTYKLGF
jgi:hypothetical protein